MVRYIVFDFDGTLADTFDNVKEIAKNEIGASENDFKLLKDKGIKNLIKEKEIPFWKIPKMALRIMSKLKNKSNIELFPEIIETLKLLKNKYKLGIVSSNTEKNIVNALKKNKIEDLFEFIYSDSSIFGKHIVLKKMCKKYKIKPSEIIYVGDEDRDIIAAKKVKIKNIAVTWGFNSKKTLKKEKPNYLVDSPKQILKKFL